MTDEKLAYSAYRDWDSLPPEERVFARPCPLWSLEDYDEAHIIGFQNRGDMKCEIERNETVSRRRNEVDIATRLFWEGCTLFFEGARVFGDYDLYLLRMLERESRPAEFSI